MLYEIYKLRKYSLKLFFYVNIKIHIIILKPNLVSLQLFAQGGVRIAK